MSSGKRDGLRGRLIIIGTIVIFVLALAGCGGKRDGSPAHGTMTLDSLADKRIGILTGSAGDNAARQRFPRAQIFDMDNIINATSALRSNKIDAVVYERTALQEIAGKNPDLAVLVSPL